MNTGSTEGAGPDPKAPSHLPAIQRPHAGRRAGWAAVAVMVVTVIVLGAAWASGLITPKTNSTGCAPSSVALTGAGSTLVFPLMYFWSTTYHDSRVNYQGVGSTAGISAITGHTVDFGASDAPLDPAQRAAAPGLMTLPESAGAVVPIYNVPGLLKPIQFTGTVLAQIYMGTITNWDSPALTSINPGITLPNATIVPVHRADGSGTTFIFSSYLDLSNPTFKSLYPHATAISWPNFEQSAKGNSGVSALVSTTTDAIGYVDIAYAEANSISYGAVQNPAGNYILANVSNSASALADSNLNLVAPTADWFNFSVLNAPGPKDYPIVSLTFVMLFQDPGTAFGGLTTLSKTENLVDFLGWAVTTGQQYSTQLFYILLPQSVVTYDENELKSVTFNGAAVAVCTSTS